MLRIQRRPHRRVPESKGRPLGKLRTWRPTTNPRGALPPRLTPIRAPNGKAISRIGSDA